MSVKVGLKFIEKWKSNLELQVCNYEKRNDEKGQIVFYGPSNFTRWCERHGNVPLEEEIVGHSGKRCAVNRGFGSSCAEHHLYYYSRMVRAIEPKVLVYAPGFGNGASFGYTMEETFELAQRVVLYALSDFPDLHVYLCGLPLFREHKEHHVVFDSWLKKFAEETPNCTFVDMGAYEPLYQKDIYAPDNKHFNQKGYKIYGELFREVLKDELAQF